MKIVLFLIFTTLSISSTLAQTAPPIEAGVSQTLAKWRAANYSDVRYKLNITLEKGAPLMKGDIEIRVNLTEAGAKAEMFLDWRVYQFLNDKDKPYWDVISVNGVPTPPSHDLSVFALEDHIMISRNLLRKGENVIKINFASPIKTSGAAITRYVDKEDGAEYVYSLFVPSDASTAFPVFDQPDLKARFKLTIKTNWNWKVISNTAPTIVQRLPTSHSEDAKKQLSETAFEETKPISTYVFAFAAGDFAEFKDCDYFEKPDLNVKSSNNRFYDIPTSEIFPKPVWASDEPNVYLYYGCEIESFRKSSLNGKNSIKDSTEKISTHSIYVRKSQAEKFLLQAYEVFRLNREGVKFLESWFDYKFPFPKYDLVLIPEFPFRGMEHAGATFLREDSIIFPTEPTKNDFVTRANVIFHEAAHQWFGDTVTMRWFDDLWLKEGFAEFMAYKTLSKVMPEYNAWKIFYERNKQLAYLTDSTRGTTPIYQEIPNLSAAKSAYGNIVYRKAPSFLRQAEFYLGEDKFQTAVRAFLKKHEFANAEWTDLVKEFETASKQDLKDWANVWVKQRGLFKMRVVRNTVSNQNSTYYSLKVESEHNLDAKLQPKTKFLIFSKEYYRDTENTFGWELPPKTPEGFIFPVFRNEPYFIFPNYQDYGYGIFLLDEKSRAYVLANIQDEKDDFLRTMMWGSLWDSVREAELAPRDYVALVIKNINVESDESTIQTLLGRVSTAMNYYLSDAERLEVAPKIEAILIDKMRNAPTVGQRITFFRAFLNIASTENARSVLKEMISSTTNANTDWTKTRKFKVKAANIYNNYQSTKDRFDIVTRLLILGDRDAPNILSELEKSETSDEAKRYAYAARAGIATAENKQKFFNDFIANKEISESYVESATLPFNSIRHSELTLPYLEKALAELPNLKRTRKIFFVTNWLAAFIGGQRSEQALQIVNKFLADNANLDKDLRLKILEASDNLERSIKIRNKN